MATDEQSLSQLIESKKKSTFTFDGTEEEDESDNIQTVQVAVRVRPFNKRELRLNSSCCIEMHENTTTIINPNTLHMAPNDQNKHSFGFDNSFWSFDERTPIGNENPIDTQEIGRGILKNALKGYNCTLVAYGQTGSGKTYSMLGQMDSPELWGIIPRMCKTIFDTAGANDDPNLKYNVEVSYLEIYSERIRDLLNPSKSKSPLKVREHPQTGPYVEDLIKCAVGSYPELDGVMRTGNQERTVAATNMNEHSSRSHAVFTIYFTQTRFDDVTNMSSDRVAKIQLVDLAGSEKVAKSGADGMRLKEAAKINLSLTMLGIVIEALAGVDDDKKKSKKAAFVPFRNSVLTWLLKDSLGGNSKTVMIAALSPAANNYEETLSTLKYAWRAKRIVNHAVVNEDPNAKIIRVLRTEVEQLRAQLANVDPTVTVEVVADLREKLAQSQKIVADINRSWEQKLEETRRQQEEAIHELKRQGIASKIDDQMPFLVNISEDPSLSGLLVYQLTAEESTVGSSDECSIILTGLKMLPFHAILKRKGTAITVAPFDPKQFPEMWLNGTRLATEQPLHHGDRIIFGLSHVFKFNHPQKKSLAGPQSVVDVTKPKVTQDDVMVRPSRVRMSRSMSTAMNASSSLLDWDFITRERAAQQGQVGSLLGKEAQKKVSRELLEEKLAILESEDFTSNTLLKSQGKQYAELLALAAELNRQEVEEKKQAQQSKAKIKQFGSELFNFESDDDSNDEQASATIREELMQLLPSVDECNAICEALGKPVRFEVELVSYHEKKGKEGTDPPTPRARHRIDSETPLQRLHKTKETRILLKVSRGFGSVARMRNRHSLWTVDDFHSALSSLRYNYNRIRDGEEEEPIEGIDGGEELQLVGTGHVYLESLLYQIGIQQRTQLLDHRGDYAGLLTVQVYCNPYDVELLSQQRAQDQEEHKEPFAPQLSEQSLHALSSSSTVDEDDEEDEQVNEVPRRRDSLLDTSVEDSSFGDYKRREKSSGRIHLSQEIPSAEPELNAPLPMTLRISRVDRVPAVGIKQLFIRYKFYNDSAFYQTETVDITLDHMRHLREESDIRRRRLPARLSKPVEFTYQMRHDILNVDSDFLSFLKNDAIAFELWATFDTKDQSQDSSRDLLRRELASQLTPTKPITDVKEESPGQIQADQRRAAFLQQAAGAERKIEFQAIAEEDDQDLPIIMRKSSEALPPPPPISNRQRGVSTPVKGTQSTQQVRDMLQKESTANKDKKGNIVFIAVDVEEMDSSGRWNPCLLKETPEVSPDIAFRITSGAERQKRFVITVIQVDHYDFILESCASMKILGTALDFSRQSKESQAPKLTENELELSVWEQNYQIHNKLIYVTSTWNKNLLSLPEMRNPTRAGERVLVKFAIALYLAKSTTPIVLEPVTALKAYESGTSVSRVKGFFTVNHSSGDRLHKIGSYYRIFHQGKGDDVDSIMEEHEKQIFKLEHNMRIEQIQQHLTLVQILRAKHHEKSDEVERELDNTLNAIQQLQSKQVEAPHDDSKVSAVKKGQTHLATTVRSVPSTEMAIRKGYLMKRGRYHTSWKRRYFVLCPPFLYYFKHANDKKFKGIIDLIGATVRTSTDESEKFNFEIKAPTRRWYLQASSVADMERWVEAILEFNELE